MGLGLGLGLVLGLGLGLNVNISPMDRFSLRTIFYVTVQCKFSLCVKVGTAQTTVYKLH